MIYLDIKIMYLYIKISCFPTEYNPWSFSVNLTMISFSRTVPALTMSLVLWMVVQLSPGVAVAGSALPVDEGLLLTNAYVVDPASQEVRKSNLLIREGMILASPDRVPPEFSGQIVDMDGKWIIPGLNDMHTHSYGNQIPGDTNDSPGTEVVAQRLLYAGVTGFLDLFGDEDTLYELRARQDAGEVGGADIFTSLSCLTATDGHCTEYGVPTRVIDSPDDARRVVTDLAKKQPDVIKIIYQPTDDQPSIDRETFTAAVATANKNSIKTVIHVKTWQDVRDAVAVGASAITHVPRGAIPDDIAGLMARNDVVSIPTLTVETEFVDFLNDPEVLDNPLAIAVSSQALVDAYRTDELRERYADRREEFEQRKVVTLNSLKVLADAGVTILTGTDAGNWGTIQGYSVHRELVKMVKAGLTTWQALAASTTAAGDFLGRPFGVNPGDEANLVVLDASPIEDIRNTQRIISVIHHGKIVQRSELL
jgi:imidazolonepropionase-like amidohydrolase